MARSKCPLTAIGPPMSLKEIQAYFLSVCSLPHTFRRFNEPLWFLRNKLVALNCIIAIAILLMVATTDKRPKGSPVTEIHIGIFAQWSMILGK